MLMNSDVFQSPLRWNALLVLFIVHATYLEARYLKFLSVEKSLQALEVYLSNLMHFSNCLLPYIWS